MSDLQRSFAKAHLANLPPEPPAIFDEREEEEEDVGDLPERLSGDSSSSASSTGTIKPSPTKQLFERSKESVFSVHMSTHSQIPTPACAILTFP